ncbi:Uncharacterised protein [uncultured archaeon]|nr:Uncharacterised protein [uncultured archaeon]
MNLRGQAATEELVLLAVVLLVLMAVLAVVVFWPSYVQTVERQESDRFWASAKPFAVNDHNMYPNQMVIELANTEPVTLTITGIYLDGASLNFSNHSVPFTWGSASSRCASGCSMAVLPGQTQIISTASFTTTPANPCVTPDGFAYGNRYKMDLVITYHASDPSALENESATEELVGICSAA